MEWGREAQQIIILGDPVILSRTGTRDQDLDLDREPYPDWDQDPAYSLLWRERG